MFPDNKSVAHIHVSSARQRVFDQFRNRLKEEIAARGSLIFKEESLPGRGIGYVALQDVKRGGLIFREFPQLSLSDEVLEDLDNLKVYVGKSVLEMSSGLKWRYMKLQNNYKI